MNMRISIANIFTHLFLLLALLATASVSYTHLTLPTICSV